MPIINPNLLQAQIFSPLGSNGVAMTALRLEKDQVLLIKVGKHLQHEVKAIQEIVDKAFGACNDRIIIFVDGDLDFQTVNANEAQISCP